MEHLLLDKGIPDLDLFDAIIVNSSAGKDSQTALRVMIMEIEKQKKSRDMVTAMKKNSLDVSFCEIEAEWGHDAFLIANPRLTELIKGFLDRAHTEN